MNIIPKPLKEKVFKGNFIFANEIIITDILFETIDYIIDFFKTKLNRTVKKGSNPNISIIVDSKLALEEYKLSVGDNGVTIRCSSDKGLFYAFQSFRQVAQLDLLTAENKICVSKLEIEDKPRFAWRAFMLDEARHFWGKDKVKQYLQMMAFHKMNVFHWHLSEDQGWRVEIKKYPLLTEKGSIRKSTALALRGYNSHKEPREQKEYGRGLFYTQEDIKEIVAYARKLKIDIVPEIDMPGHLVSAIACYPELSCFEDQVEVSDRWGVLSNIGCCGKNNIYEFAKNVIDELVQLFPFEYFHIGGDEVPKDNWKKCPKCQAKIKELNLTNEHDLQGYFSNQIMEHLKTQNKRMIGWNEILDSAKLNDDVVIQWWTSGSAKAINWLKKGNNVILSKVNYLYLDHLYSMRPLDKTYKFDLESLKIPAEYEKNILGIEAPQWTEYIRTTEKLDMNTFPRLQAVAELGWTAKVNRNFSDFEERLLYTFKVLEQNKIGYAKRKVYLLKGISGAKRCLTQGITWLNNPNKELELNK